jgi:hypothetical protein
VLIDLTVMVAVSEAYSGRAIDVGLVFRRSLPRSGATLAATIAKYGFVVACGLLCALPVFAMRLAAIPYEMRFLIIGGAISAFIAVTCYLIGLFVAATAVVALDGAGPIAALQRSVQLSRGRVRHVLAGMTLAYALYFVGLLPIILLAGGGARILAQFLSVAASILIFPLLSSTRVVLYYDLQIRHEGYDLELMAQRVAAAGLPSH